MLEVNMYVGTVNIFNSLLQTPLCMLEVNIYGSPLNVSL